MQIDKLTKKSIRKAEQMLKALSEFKYVKVKRNGTTIFKNHWYSFGLRVSMYQLLTKELPQRLSLESGKNKKLYLYRAFDIISDNIYDCNDLIDLYYEEYVKTCYPDVNTLHKNKLQHQKNHFQSNYYFGNPNRMLQSKVTLTLLEAIALVNVLKKHKLL